MVFHYQSWEEHLKEHRCKNIVTWWERKRVPKGTGTSIPVLERASCVGVSPRGWRTKQAHSWSICSLSWETLTAVCKQNTLFIPTYASFILQTLLVWPGPESEILSVLTSDYHGLTNTLRAHHKPFLTFVKTTFWVNHSLMTAAEKHTHTVDSQFPRLSLSLAHSNKHIFPLKFLILMSERNKYFAYFKTLRTSCFTHAHALDMLLESTIMIWRIYSIKNNSHNEYILIRTTPISHFHVVLSEPPWVKTKLLIH